MGYRFDEVYRLRLVSHMHTAEELMRLIDCIPRDDSCAVVSNKYVKCELWFTVRWQDRTSLTYDCVHAFMKEHIPCVLKIFAYQAMGEGAEDEDDVFGTFCHAGGKALADEREEQWQDDMAKHPITTGLADLKARKAAT